MQRFIKKKLSDSNPSPLSTAPRRRESERSVENEVFSSRDEDSSSHGNPTTTSKQEGLPLKVVLAPPPKENAWAKRSTMSAGSSESDSKPVVSPSSSAPPKRFLSGLICYI